MDDCDAAIAADGYRPKALFRRARAEEALGHPAKAIRDLRLLARIDPGNGAAVKQLRLLRAQMLAKPAGLRAALGLIRDAAAGDAGAGVSQEAAVHELRKVCAVCHGEKHVGRRGPGLLGVRRGKMAT